ncbi:hypothetical protein [Desmospora profundinema]|uniref:Uncharacterized protein n=1 Tax=Desmospora profundinema TaxID=1571184 RepID=A0ABU1IR89_9BACL|nr:hypothetical protein [Desmospora profundinema]MDR6227062.1 hypothetical protein [Desmospora profundinema]
MKKNKLPEPPKEIAKQVLKYKKSGENEEIFSWRVKHHDQLYHYAIYWKGKKVVGHIIVREDGSVPTFSEAKTIIRIAVSVNTILRFFILHGRRWAHTVDEVWHKQSELLERMYQKYKGGMSGEVKRSFQEFIDVPKGILKEYRVIQEANRAVKQLDQEMIQRGDITDQSMERELDKAWNQLFHAKNNQHLLFHNTKESREEVIHFLSQKIPLWDLKGRWELQKIKAQHRNMLLNKDELDAVLDVQDDVTRKESGEKEFKEILANTRNPR